jgi:hypothetical protein
LLRSRVNNPYLPYTIGPYAAEEQGAGHEHKSIFFEGAAPVKISLTKTTFPESEAT